MLKVSHSYFLLRFSPLDISPHQLSKALCSLPESVPVLLQLQKSSPRDTRFHAPPSLSLASPLPQTPFPLPTPLPPATPFVLYNFCWRLPKESWGGEPRVARRLPCKEP